MEETNPLLGEQFKKVIRNQIRTGKPPITKETYNRLIKEGHDKSKAIRLMSCAIAAEIYNMAKENRKFNDNLYSRMLSKLPDMPWDK